MKQVLHAASSHSSRGASAWAQAVPSVLSSSAMQPETLKVVSSESVIKAPAFVGTLPLVGSMQARQVALAEAVNQSLHVVVVAVVDAQAVTKAETSAGVQAPRCWTGVTKAGTLELATLAAGVGHVGPPPLLDPDPLLLPELEPEELPELEPDELPEPEPDEPPELDPPEPPPELEPELPPLPPPLEEELVQAWFAARMQAVVSTQDAQPNVCEPTV